ncbi:MAG TPA: Os1348 family NHLP clan protein [Miltoncostaeaceae bacterium]|nr:Os1348 family NHLP clan protein [Miltoncostaeaceae bacterium]
MPDPPPRPSLWGRAVADPEFRAALIADPLRALAEHGAGVAASPEQVRRLEAMTPAEREELVREVVREVAVRRAREQWGDRFWSPDHDDLPPPGTGRPPEGA